MDQTLEYYNNTVKDYIQDTVDANVTELNSFFLKYIPAGGSILDLGCGSGRDSKLYINKGYHVTAVDGSEEFCKLAGSYIGQEVLCMKFDEIEFENEFDGVWACASILHVSLKDLTVVIEKIAKALKSGGYFFACFKYGDFEGLRNGRYFTDLTESKLLVLLQEVCELELIETSITTDVRPERKDENWLNIILRKTE